MSENWRKFDSLYRVLESYERSCKACKLWGQITSESSDTWRLGIID